MPPEIKGLDPDKISPSEFRTVLGMLMGLIEQLSSEVDALKEQNRQLSDEIKRLNGTSARPRFPDRSKKGKDISSGGKEAGARSSEKENKEIKEFATTVDVQLKVSVDRKLLPEDAVFKGHVSYIQQDIVINRCNKEYLFEVWYSPSSGKTIRAPWPKGEKGHYGPGLRGLLNVLRHMSDVTEPQLHKLLRSFGVKISAGTISNLLKKESSWASMERLDILRSGLAGETPMQMDSTATRQKGKSRVTHIVGNPNFTVFQTTDGKSRLECLRILQGNPKDGLKLLWFKDVENILREAQVKAVHAERLKQVMKDKPCATLAEFDRLMKEKAPDTFNCTHAIKKMREAMAFAYYRQQADFPPVDVLLSDDAHEYWGIPRHHGLCWVHDGRRYNALAPRMDLFAQKLEAFKTRYWEYYRKLLDYTKQPSTTQEQLKQQLVTEFDDLFVPDTGYLQLDKTIALTLHNKDKLLMVLEFPEIPLHNNAIELAARRVVRKRDISLHNWSEWGTELRDSFLSIIQTACKLGVSPYQYICDRVSRKYHMESLASIIDRKISLTTTF